MKGSYQIRIESKFLTYSFTVRRNITIIRGDSATGKTTLIAMLQAHQEDAESSGITVRCDRQCVVLTSARWEDNLASIHDSIVFIDEGGRFMRSEEFAAAVARSSNYYVLITREGLDNLPYSVDEIYGVRLSQQYAGLKKTYNELYHIYHPHRVDRREDEVIVEDSNSGYQFFRQVFQDLPCKSAGGKSNIAAIVKAASENKTVLIIADGAAFGCEMEHMDRLINSGADIILYLPESFEWLILHSGLLHDQNVRDILENPSEYIDSGEYVSWERFFAHILAAKTQGTWLAYSKSRLNTNYLDEKVRNQICRELPDVIR